MKMNELRNNLFGIVNQVNTPKSVKSRVAIALNVIDDCNELLHLSTKGYLLNTGKIIEPKDVDANYNELECALSKKINLSTADDKDMEVKSFKEYLNFLINQTNSEKQIRIATTLNVITDCENVWKQSFKGARLNVGTFIFPKDVGNDYNEVNTALNLQSKSIKNKM